MTAAVAQVALCTADLARTVRRYGEGFGFVDAGGRMMWGPRSATIQGLGDDTTGAIWWLVGRQPFLNLELFRHSQPRQRPLPADWMPNWPGWVRWGFAVDDFDAAAAYLRRSEVACGAVATIHGARRICFRDPDAGVVVEVMEETAALPGAAAAPPDGGPRLVYAALSVSDLARARRFYADSFEMEPGPPDLHPPETEALWGLPGATRRIEVLDGTRGMFLELVQYAQPQGRRRSDARLSDQGLMNIAFGYRERAEAERAIERALAAGATLNAPLANQAAAATYLNDPFGHSIEVLCVPESQDAAYGWKGRPPAYR
jgi:catechol 2,3-dioxygenase-like lactoylglutathione lyase family enzyme